MKAKESPMQSHAHPTPYPAVNAALNTMCDAVKRTLGKKFIGFYIYGSLANGDFDVNKSDIDAVVVTSTPLDEVDLEQLKEMHAQLFAQGSKWIREFELFYMPRQDMKKYNPTDALRARCHEGVFTADFWQGDDWVLHRHVLREQGIIVAGPSPSSLIDPVTPEDIRTALKVGILQNWWENKVLKKPDRLGEAMYQAHAILTMCRALFTLETGKLKSKMASAAWVLPRLSEPYKNLVSRAMAWQPGMNMNDYQATIDFIQATVTASKDKNSLSSLLQISDAAAPE